MFSPHMPTYRPHPCHLQFAPFQHGVFQKLVPRVVQPQLHCIAIAGLRRSGGAQAAEAGHDETLAPNGQTPAGLFMGKNGDWSWLYLVFLLGYSYCFICIYWQIHWYGHIFFFLYSYFLGHTDLPEYMVRYVTNGCLRDILGIIMGSIGILREVSSISAPQTIPAYDWSCFKMEGPIAVGYHLFKGKVGRWSGMSLARKRKGQGVTMKWAWWFPPPLAKSLTTWSRYL